MNFVKDTGFVIKRVNVGEADRYLTIFSKESGKIELLARGVRKISSRRSSHIELLNLIKFQAVKGPRNVVLTDTELINPFDNAKKDIDQVGRLFLMCELIDKLCPFGQQNITICKLLYAALRNSEKKNTELLAREFQIGLLTTLGYWDVDKNFQDQDDIQQFIESILERKLKTNLVFGFSNS